MEYSLIGRTLELRILQYRFKSYCFLKTIKGFTNKEYILLYIIYNLIIKMIKNKYP